MDLELLLAALALPLPLLVSLLVDTRSERVLEAKRNLVHDKDQRREGKTSWLSQPDRRAQERHGRTVVHWCVGDVERETRHHVVHQNAKVVAQVGPCDAECPHGGQDEDVSARDQGGGDEFGEGCHEEGMGGLLAEGALVAGAC